MKNHCNIYVAKRKVVISCVVFHSGCMVSTQLFCTFAFAYISCETVHMYPKQNYGFFMQKKFHLVPSLSILLSAINIAVIF